MSKNTNTSDDSLPGSKQSESLIDKKTVRQGSNSSVRKTVNPNSRLRRKSTGTDNGFSASRLPKKNIVSDNSNLACAVKVPESSSFNFKPSSAPLVSFQEQKLVDTDLNEPDQEAEAIIKDITDFSTSIKNFDSIALRLKTQIKLLTRSSQMKSTQLLAYRDEKKDYENKINSSEEKILKLTEENRSLLVSLQSYKAENDSSQKKVLGLEAELAALKKTIENGISIKSEFDQNLRSFLKNNENELLDRMQQRLKNEVEGQNSKINKFEEELAEKNKLIEYLNDKLDAAQNLNNDIVITFKKEKEADRLNEEKNIANFTEKCEKQQKTINSLESDIDKYKTEASLQSIAYSDLSQSFDTFFSKIAESSNKFKSVLETMWSILDLDHKDIKIPSTISQDKISKAVEPLTAIYDELIIITSRVKELHLDFQSSSNEDINELKDKLAAKVEAVIYLKDREKELLRQLQSANTPSLNSLTNTVSDQLVTETNQGTTPSNTSVQFVDVGFLDFASRKTVLKLLENELKTGKSTTELKTVHNLLSQEFKRNRVAEQLHKSTILELRRENKKLRIFRTKTLNKLPLSSSSHKRSKMREDNMAIIEIDRIKLGVANKSLYGELVSRVVKYLHENDLITISVKYVYGNILIIRLRDSFQNLPKKALSFITTNDAIIFRHISVWHQIIVHNIPIDTNLSIHENCQNLYHKLRDQSTVGPYSNTIVCLPRLLNPYEFYTSRKNPTASFILCYSSKEIYEKAIKNGIITWYSNKKLRTEPVIEFMKNPFNQIGFNLQFDLFKNLYEKRQQIGYLGDGMKLNFGIQQATLSKEE